MTDRYEDPNWPNQGTIEGREIRLARDLGHARPGMRGLARGMALLWLAVLVGVGLFLAYMVFVES